MLEILPELPATPRITSHGLSDKNLLPSLSGVTPGMWRTETTTVSPGRPEMIRSMSPGSSFSARYLTTSGWTCILVSRNRCTIVCASSIDHTLLRDRIKGFYLHTPAPPVPIPSPRGIPYKSCSSIYKVIKCRDQARKKRVLHCL